MQQLSEPDAKTMVDKRKPTRAFVRAMADLGLAVTVRDFFSHGVISEIVVRRVLDEAERQQIIDSCDRDQERDAVLERLAGVAAQPGD
jgi:hypothetical protein